MIFKFSKFTIDTNAFKVFKGSEEITLTKRPFNVLLLLLKNRKKVLNKQTILEELWGKTQVREDSVTRAVSTINTRLGESIIRNVSGVGYQFNLEVKETEEQVEKATGSNAYSENEYTRRIGEDFSRIKWNPSEGFHWYVIAGASSSGKNVVSGMATQRLKHKGIEVVRHRKVSTRKPLSSNEFDMLIKTEDEFNDMHKEGKLLLPYIKLGYKIGFYAEDLFRAMQNGSPIISLFKEFSRLPYMHNWLTEKQIDFTIIYLKVPASELQERTRFRNLAPELMQHKQDSIPAEVENIFTSPGFLDICKTFPNGNGSALQLTVDELVNLIEGNYLSAEYDVEEKVG